MVASKRRIERALCGIVYAIRDDSTGQVYLMGEAGLKAVEEQATEQPSVYNQQVGGDHYAKLGEYQPWMVAGAWLNEQELIGYAKGTVMAYLARDKVSTIEDMRKAKHTLELFLAEWDKRYAL